MIASDLEPDMVRFLNQCARREQLPNLRAIQATPIALGLAASSVDRILVVHVWHHRESFTPFGKAGTADDKYES